MSFIKYKVYVVLLLGAILSIGSCTGADEYLKFTEGGAISYTGKMESLKVLSGRNRVKVEGLIISDPKVTEMRVYWNNKKDSVVVPIIRTSGVDAVSTIIENLPENIYNFEVKTFDAKGNASVPQSVNAQTYGERYQASLTDRKIISSKLSSNLSLPIDFATMDLNTGAYATEIVYTDKFDVERTVTVPVATSKIVIADYKKGSQFKQRSLFLPNKACIDIFYTDFVAKVPQINITPDFLANYGPGFTKSIVSGRWGVLAAPWVTNAAAKNKSGTYGGYTTDQADGVVGNICWETYGNTPITNGIIYQPTSMPLSVGSYTITFKVFSEIQTNSSVYCVVAAGGNGIPVLANLSTAIASVALPNPAVVGTNNPKATETKTLTFNITTPQVVSIGFLGNLTANNYFWVSYIELVKN